MAETRYNFDKSFSLTNRFTGHVFINDVEAKRVYCRPSHARKLVLAEFCITDLVWNDSSKDLDKIRLESSTSGSGVEYTITSNHGALMNRLYKEVRPSADDIAIPSSMDKKFMYFSTNKLLYEFILLIVKRIQEDRLPRGAGNVTLTQSSTDSTDYINGVFKILASDEDGNAIKGLKITGNIGEDEVEETTDNNGYITLNLTTPGKQDYSLSSEATDSYTAQTKTGSVTVTARITPTIDAVFTDSETLTNANGVIRACDDGTPIEGLTVTGTIGAVTVNSQTDGNGEISVTLESAGEYEISLESTSTTLYKAGSYTGSVTVETITQQTPEQQETPGEQQGG